MSGKVFLMYGKGVMTPEQVRAFNELDAVLLNALNAAKSAGVAQGLIVAILHGHAYRETHEMVYSDEID